MLLRRGIPLVRYSADSLFLADKLSTDPIRRTAHEGAFRRGIRDLSATSPALAVAKRPPSVHQSITPVLDGLDSRTTRTRARNEASVRAGLNGCNLPREVVRLMKDGTSTGRRLARTIPSDSPTEGLSPSDSVPKGHRYSAGRDTRFSRGRKSRWQDPQAAGAIER